MEHQNYHLQQHNLHQQHQHHLQQQHILQAQQNIQQHQNLDVNRIQQQSALQQSLPCVTTSNFHPQQLTQQTQAAFHKLQPSMQKQYIQCVPSSSINQNSSLTSSPSKSPRSKYNFYLAQQRQPISSSQLLAETQPKNTKFLQIKNSEVYRETLKPSVNFLQQDVPQQEVLKQDVLQQNVLRQRNLHQTAMQQQHILQQHYDEQRYRNNAMHLKQMAKENPVWTTSTKQVTNSPYSSQTFPINKKITMLSSPDQFDYSNHISQQRAFVELQEENATQVDSKDPQQQHLVMSKILESSKQTSSIPQQKQQFSQSKSQTTNDNAWSAMQNYNALFKSSVSTERGSSPIDFRAAPEVSRYYVTSAPNQNFKFQIEDVGNTETSNQREQQRLNFLMEQQNMQKNNSFELEQEKSAAIMSSSMQRELKMLTQRMRDVAQTRHCQIEFVNEQLCAENVLMFLSHWLGRLWISALEKSFKRVDCPPDSLDIYVSSNIDYQTSVQKLKASREADASQFVKDSMEQKTVWNNSFTDANRSRGHQDHLEKHISKDIADESSQIIMSDDETSATGIHAEKNFKGQGNALRTDDSMAGSLEALTDLGLDNSLFGSDKTMLIAPSQVNAVPDTKFAETEDSSDSIRNMRQTMLMEAESRTKEANAVRRRQGKLTREVVVDDLLSALQLPSFTMPHKLKVDITRFFSHLLDSYCADSFSSSDADAQALIKSSLFGWKSISMNLCVPMQKLQPTD